MRHQVKKTTLGRKSAPRKALLRNLVTSVILHESVVTTESKAKAIRPILEKTITVSRKGDLAARRQLMKILFTKTAVDKALTVVGPKYKERPGGYTRIVKIGRREGDGAEMARIELL